MKEQTLARKFRLQANFWDASLAKIHPDIAKDVFDWVEKPKGILFLRGHVGCGKTYLMAAILNEKIEKMREKNPHLGVRFYKETRLHFELRKAIQEGFDYEQKLQELCEAEIFFLDDLGAADITKHKAEAITTFLDERYNDNRKITIISSNFDNQQILENYKDRAYGRLITDRCKEILFPAINYRAQKIEDPFKFMKE